MVKYGKLPPRQPPQKAPTTQFDLVEAKIGDAVSMARPYQFAKVPGTEDEYATHFSTACPHCGHGITIEISQPPDVEVTPAGVSYKKPVLNGVCSNCKAGEVQPPRPLEDPFRNPILEGLVTMADLDPLQAAAALLTTPVTTAADRIKQRQQAVKLEDQGALELGEEPPEEAGEEAAE